MLKKYLKNVKHVIKKLCTATNLYAQPFGGPQGTQQVQESGQEPSEATPLHVLGKKSWKMNTNHEDIGYNFEDDPKEKMTLKSHLNISDRRAWMMVLSSFFEHILSMGFQMTLRDLSVEWLKEFYHNHGLTA
ncbi:hypothetical protein HJG60_010823 [Phyllostomus discolor]|uniref:Uncharacterized protein n=1 Tax=Phyllostomus discolor TaxID=89673 RepID=A0A834E6E6_9CHIR|nr:hypothetical protein HJG60_010823 [Phyllostomus discolor]